MKKKIVSAILLALLITSLLTFTFKIQPARAQVGPIYIRADGSIDPPTANITSTDNITYTFTSNIYADNGIVVEKDDIVVDGAGHTLQPLDYFWGGVGISLAYRSNVTVTNAEISIFGAGIWLSYSSNITITNNRIYGNEERSISLMSSDSNNIYENYVKGGEHAVINLSSSSNNTISRNTITGGWFCGVQLETSSSNNTITGNTITCRWGGIVLSSSNNNTVTGNCIAYANAEPSVLGIQVGSSSDNIIYHNNFIDNGQHTGATHGYVNTWDNGYPSGGNYWDDYDGIDLYSGPDQNEPGSDGIGDTPYLIAAGNRDNYPLISIRYEFDVAITNVLPITTVVAPGDSLSVNVTVKNQGLSLSSVTFSLTVEATHMGYPPYKPVRMGVTLQASAAQGWNYSIPGPTITAQRGETVGDTIVLTLEGVDNLHHKFYVDYNGNEFPDADEPQSPPFISTTILYEFTVDTAGSFTYYCAYHQETMFGPFVVNQLPPLPPPPPISLSQDVTLAYNEEKNVTFTWDTEGFAVGKYMIEAYAAPVWGEFYTADNTFTDSTVLVGFLGDTEYDGDVDAFDLSHLSQAYGPIAADPYCDCNEDGKVDVQDLYALGKNYGKTV